MLKFHNNSLKKSIKTSWINRESCNILINLVIFLNNKTTIGNFFFEEYHTHLFQNNFQNGLNNSNSNCLLRINHQIDYNSTMSNFTSLNSSFTGVEIDLNYPDESYLNETLNYLNSLSDQDLHKLCMNCLDKFDLWKDVEIQINKIYNDMNSLHKICDSQSEIASLFMFKINQLNSAISKIHNSKILIKIIKAAKCTNEAKIDEVYHNIWRLYGELVDSIQNFIRKKNINLNFILIQEKN